MKNEGIPIIIVCTYILNEIYKIIVKKNSKAYKLIPILSNVIGGILGILIYITESDLLKVTNIYEALLLGIISGSSATGTNQIIKQIFYKKEETKEEKENER